VQQQSNVTNTTYQYRCNWKLTTLPIDVVLNICQFSDDTLSLQSFRISSRVFYEIAENEPVRFFSQVDTLILESEEQYYSFFTELMKQACHSSTINRAMIHLLVYLMNGCNSLIAQYGFISKRYILDMFMECLFVVLEKGSNISKSLFLSILAEHTDLWLSIDQLCGSCYPREHILNLCDRLRDNSTELSHILEILGVVGDLNLLDIKYLQFTSDTFRFIPETSYGFTLLHILTWINNRSAIDLLLTNTNHIKAKINRKDAMGRTCLYYCVIDDSLHELAEYLLTQYSNYIDPFITDNEGVSPVFLAHLYQKGNILELFKTHSGSTQVDEHIEEIANSRNDEYHHDQIDNTDSAYDCGDDECIEFISDDSEEEEDPDFEKDEEGIGIKFINQSIRENRMEDIEEVIEYFKSSDTKENYLIDPEQPDIIHYVHEVKQTSNILQLLKDQFNENNKRIRSSNQTVWEVHKKRRICDIQSLVDKAVITRTDLEIPKETFNEFVEVIGSDYKTILEWPSLSLFILQSASETLLTNLYKDAMVFANHYKRDYIHVRDFQYALKKRCIVTDDAFDRKYITSDLIFSNLITHLPRK
jgi:histone H3/H4